MGIHFKIDERLEELFLKNVLQEFIININNFNDNPNRKNE